MELFINAAIITAGILAGLIAVPVAIMLAVVALAALVVLFSWTLERFKELGDWLREGW